MQQLLPGVVLAAQGQAASFIALNTNLTFSINGTRPSASLYMLDGAINMDLYNDTPAAFPNPDALQEFTIQTTNYTSVVGGSPGAAVNMVTKSGTNAYHGELYEFLRNTDLNARNFFAATIPAYHRNQFGANAGGPIRRNKAFFFGAYEGNRQRQPVTSAGNVVPTALERQGNFSQSKLPTGPVLDPTTNLPLPNNTIPTSRLDQVAQNFAAAFLPLPNFGANQFNYTASIPYTDDQGTGRLDYNFSDRSHLMLRYLYDDYRYLNNDALLAFNSGYDWATHNAAISYQYSFNATTTNFATFVFNRNTFIRAPLATDPASWAALGCVSCIVTHPAGVPTDWNLSVTGGVGIRSSTAFLSYMQNEEFVDSFSKSIGNHLLSMGGTVIKARRHGEEYPSGASPVFTFDGTRSGSGDGYADYMLGVPITVAQTTEGLSWTHKIVPSLFIEDDWKVNRKLTLNLGLRWEPYLSMHEQHNRLSAFRPGMQSALYPNAPEGLVFAGDPGVPDTIITSEWMKFAPRVGFAYDPQGNGKTSIRGAYGWFNDTPRLVVYNIYPGRQPFSLGTTLSDPYSMTDPYRNAPTIYNALSAYAYGGVPVPSPSTQFVLPIQVSSIASGFTNGYVEQWNLNVQREIVKDFVATAAYVGSKGTHLQIPEEQNGAPYIPGNCLAGQYGLTAPGACSTSGNINNRRIYQPFALIESIESNGNSTYHALQLTLNKRFGAGYSILSSYTFSKFIDMTSDDGHGSTGSTATDPFNWNFDHGIADNNRTHRFTTSFVWQVPAFRKASGLKGGALGGWQFNGIVLLQSGVPFSCQAGVNRSLSGGAGDRCDLIGSGPVATFGDGSVKKYFDTSRFALPALGTFGSAGRNILAGPGYADVDMSLFKSFRITESKSLVLRWEVFNLFNRANFGNPSGTFSSAVFGQITSAMDPRIMQVALKFIF